jgi:hypothetical protein
VEETVKVAAIGTFFVCGFLVAFGTFMIGAGALGWQCLVWLKTGVWPPVSVWDLLILGRMQPTWLGLAQIPAWMLMLVGLLPWYGMMLIADPDSVE